MKNSISNTFKHIRKLPLEVRFEQVENWIQQHEYQESKSEQKPFSKMVKWVYLFSKN